MRLNETQYFHWYQPAVPALVIHSSKLIYPREIYQRGVERKRVELIARTSMSTSLTSRRSASAMAGTM